ncbi:MAG: hydantoinase/oxoprolinase family protein [Betaproteobacteria bacterium]
MGWTIGVDVGGTFTDLFAVNDETGDIRLWKRPSTPENPAGAVASGVQELASAHGISLRDVTRLAHGTTVATNALIQRRGRPVALITTRGFRDLVEIGRQTRPHIYDLQLDYPAPLVPRHRRLEVTERIIASGAVHVPLDMGEVEEAIARIQEMKVESVAVCFLFAFLNPDHERRVADLIRARAPGIHVSTSSEVQPEFREYERFTTTIINAYLQPILSHYMASLQTDLAAILPRASIGINQSSGGLMTVARAKSFPVRTALSGPAAGVVGALHIASTVNRENVLSIDVGGTSADVALIMDGKVNVSYGRDVDGFPIRLPMVDIHTIGAGGGSIAWFDKDGLLKMGPQSAGARPGPACYGHGGTAATLSDTNLVLGRLSPNLLDGAMKLDAKLARQAIEAVASPMGKSVEEAAMGMVAISVSNMVRAIRELSVERGHDPREFALMPFGGAGPMHAHDIAVAMSIKEIIVPRSPGLVCAQGLVIAEIKETFTGSAKMVIGDAMPPSLRELVAELKARAYAWAASEGVAATALDHDLAMDMRYVGQNYELSVPTSCGTMSDLGGLPDMASLKQLFFKAHDVAYSFHDASGKVELLNLRLIVRAPVSTKMDLPPDPESAVAWRAMGERSVYFSGNRAITSPVYKREHLPAGARVDGPAIIDQIDTTIPIFPGSRAVVHPSGNLLVEVVA